MIPSLYHNSTVGASRPNNLISVILHGVDRTVAGHHVLMPGFGEASYAQPLSDGEIASLATFLRQTFGRGDSVSEKQVALARSDTSLPILLLLARTGMAAGALFVLGLLVWRQRRRSRKSVLR